MSYAFFNFHPDFWSLESMFIFPSFLSYYLRSNLWFLLPCKLLAKFKSAMNVIITGVLFRKIKIPVHSCLHGCLLTFLILNNLNYLSHLFFSCELYEPIFVIKLILSSNCDIKLRTGQLCCAHYWRGLRRNLCRCVEGTLLSCRESHVWSSV